MVPVAKALSRWEDISRIASIAVHGVVIGAASMFATGLYVITASTPLLVWSPTLLGGFLLSSFVFLILSGCVIAFETKRVKKRKQAAI